MALLTRYFQLNDSDGTQVGNVYSSFFFFRFTLQSSLTNDFSLIWSQVFNFVVTKSVTREFGRNVISKDFEFGFHRWALSFSKEDKVG
jgi:hypothetical protein